MSKIQQIQSGRLSCSNPTKRKNSASEQNFRENKRKLMDSGVNNYNPNFGSAQSELSNKVAKAIEKARISSGDKFKEYLAMNDGEVQTQLINAVFTTTLAPLVIAYNPVSDKSKEDKQYLAWRQPLSAIIAVAGSMPATLAINKQFAKLGSEGYFKNLDIRMCPHGDYLNKEFKAEYSKHKKTNTLNDFAKTLGIQDDLLESKNIFAKMYNRAKLKDGYTKKVKDDSTKFFTEFLSSDFKDISINDETKEIQIKSSDGKILSRKVPRMETIEAVKEYYDKNAVNERKIGSLMEERFGFEFFGDGKLKPETANRFLSETLAKDFLEGIGFVKEITPVQLEEITNKYRGKDIPDTKEAKRTARMIQHSIGEVDKSKITLNQFLARFEFIDDNTGAKKLETLQEFMNKKISNVWDELKTKFKSCDTTLENENEGQESKKIINIINNQKTKEFTSNLMKKQVKILEEKFKSLNKVNGMVANLFVTAVTCTILNWVYPRFMDKFFPKLSASKAQSEKMKGGNK